MNDPARLVSKVLVLERDPDCLGQLKSFCESHDLVSLKVQPENVMSVLRSNIDLGGIFLSETFAATPAASRALAHRIQAVRPELPIFLRCETPADLPDADRNVVCAVYSSTDMDALVPVIGASIFSFVYPNALVRGISELTVTALTAQFKHATVQTEAPYIVRDRIIHGELFTLIPIESSWCRGFMTLQVKEDEMRRLTGCGFEPNFRELNNAFGEVTNLIWGAFKNRYITYGDSTQHPTQIPIVVNHLHSYISFGSEDPQLCFRYTLSDPARPEVPPMLIYQRFIFNLCWSPDDLKENQSSVEKLIETGEIELF